MTMERSSDENLKKFGQNYTPNTVEWPAGSYVIHDFDAKRADMLMRVVEPVEGGKLRTEYVDLQKAKAWGGRGKTSRLVNLIAELHDPARFDIALPPAEVPSIAVKRASCMSCRKPDAMEAVSSPSGRYTEVACRFCHSKYGYGE
jgi:hypothetical protein